MISLNCRAQTAKSLSHLDDWLQSCRRLWGMFITVEAPGIWKSTLFWKWEITKNIHLPIFSFPAQPLYIFCLEGNVFFLCETRCFSIVKIRSYYEPWIPEAVTAKAENWWMENDAFLFRCLGFWCEMFVFGRLTPRCVLMRSDCFYCICHTLHGVSILHLASYLAQLSTTAYYPTKIFSVSLGFRLQLFTQPLVPARFANGFRHDVGSCSSQCSFFSNTKSTHFFCVVDSNVGLWSIVFHTNPVIFQRWLDEMGFLG